MQKGIIQTMSKREIRWLIQGYKGTTKIYETRVDVGQVLKNQLGALLMALTAKAG
jgi:hypothetical protein